MKSKKSFLCYLLLVIAMVLTSVATTLALVTDEHNKESDIIKFDKVALQADKKGSILSMELDNLTGNGEIIFDKNVDGKFLRVNPTSDTAECFIRFKLSYTLGSEELDDENYEVLDYLNNQEALNKGFEPYNVENNNYGYTYTNGYYYLVTASNGTETLLKVATSSDSVNGFIISEKMTLYVAETDENATQEEKIDAIVTLAENYEIMLKVEVEAIQCLNLGNEILDFEDNIENSNGILSSEEEQSLETIFGNITIAHYEKAMKQNYDAIEKIPTVYLKTFAKEQTTSNSYNKPFLGSYGYSSYPMEFRASTIRGSIKSLKLTGTKPVLTGKEVAFTGKVIANGNYHKYDVGTEPGHIFAYWVKNGTYRYDGSSGFSAFDVIVYQEGGVVLNPDSRYLFAGVGAHATDNMTLFDMSDWEWNTVLVKDMSYMFYSTFSYLGGTIKFPKKFETKNVEKINNMFQYCGTSVQHIYLGGFGVGNKNLNKLPATNIFYNCGAQNTVGTKLANFYVANQKINDWLISSSIKPNHFKSCSIVGLNY